MYLCKLVNVSYWILKMSEDEMLMDSYKLLKRPAIFISERSSRTDNVKQITQLITNLHMKQPTWTPLSYRGAIWARICGSSWQCESQVKPFRPRTGAELLLECHWEEEISTEYYSFVQQVWVVYCGRSCTRVHTLMSISSTCWQDWPAEWQKNRFDWW